MLDTLASTSARRDLIGWSKANHWRTSKCEGVEHSVPIWKSKDLLEHAVHDQAAFTP